MKHKVLFHKIDKISERCRSETGHHTFFAQSDLVYDIHYRIFQFFMHQSTFRDFFCAGLDVCNRFFFFFSL